MTAGNCPAREKKRNELNEGSIADRVLGLGSFLVAAAAGRVYAIKPFSDEFTAKYVKKDEQRKKDQDFAKLVEETKCLVCHMGKSKKDRNPYGVELAKLLDNKTDKDNKDKDPLNWPRLRSCLQTPKTRTRRLSAS